MPAVFVMRPVRSIEDLGAAIIAAVYGAGAATDAASPDAVSADARPVPRNLDALADLLRETRVKRVVVTDWGMPEASIGGLLEVLADEGHDAYVIERVRAATAADAKVAGRLALWGRRLVGEALSQAQRVAADRDALTSLLTGSVDRPGMDLAAISRMFSRLVANHTQRMAQLGLSA